jgi:hypothetical protein
MVLQVLLQVVILLEVVEEQEVDLVGLVVVAMGQMEVLLEVELPILEVEVVLLIAVLLVLVVLESSLFVI